MPSRLIVALVQERNHGSTDENLTIIASHIATAAAQGAQLVVLQELHNGPYFCQEEGVDAFERAESIPGPSTKRLSELAGRHKIVIVGSLFERRAAGLYHNTAVVFDNDGRLAGIYRKMHIPDDPGYYEKYYFAQGDTGFNPIPTAIGRLGVLVCWDQWFPEAARLTALAGADLLIYPTAIGWDPNDPASERALQKNAWLYSHHGHAVANALPVLTCNRVGFEPSRQHTGIEFWGHSHVLGPQGEMLAQTGQDPTLLICEIALSRTERVRQMWPFFRDRRIDAYGDLLTRYRDSPQ